ncbi:MAG TPA: hypothetical protein VMG60_15740 [Burkholderiaceae bacterium]|nr:hypothetical protein [Burkholderiaceae bacterium]
MSYENSKSPCAIATSVATASILAAVVVLALSLLSDHVTDLARVDQKSIAQIAKQPQSLIGARLARQASREPQPTERNPQ